MTVTDARPALCEGCGGRGQIASGVQCPVCKGTGVASPADLTAWRQSVVDQALASVRRQLVGGGTAAVTDWLREGAQARQEAQQAALRATVAADEARAHAQAPHAEAQAVLAQARAVLAQAEAIAQAAAPAALPPGTPAGFIPPDPTDPPPGAPIPPGFGAGDIFYFDSILARQVDVWGALNVVGGVAGSTVANVLTFGADPTGVADSTAAFNAAYNSLPISGMPGRGGVVYAPAGIYKISSTLQFNAVAPVTLLGDGSQATTISYTGTGDCISMYNNYHPAGGGPSSILVWGGGVQRMTIDCTNATAPVVALHTGDMKYGRFEWLNISNVTGTGSIGLWQDNRKFWTEDCLYEIHFTSCQTCCVIDTSGAATGAGLVHDNNTFIFSGGAIANGNGTVITNGANCYNCWFFIHGGIPTSSVAPVPQNYLLTITGQGPSSGPKSQASHCDLYIKFESDGGLAFAPGLILLNAAGNNLGDCHGHITYQTGNGITPSTVNGNFNFTGPIVGDTGLLTVPGVTPPVSGTVYTNNNPPVTMNVTGGTVQAIKINGTPTALLAGSFYIAAGQTYEVDWTVAPTVTFITAVPQ